MFSIRDRTPFVLTSDMAYVINGGDKPSAKFHHFVDLCCQAFNIVRKHGNLILHLFGLVCFKIFLCLKENDYYVITMCYKVTQCKTQRYVFNIF